jgi:hypothetical protein
MAKTYSWSTDAEEVRRLFTFTFEDLHFLESLRADAQRLYRALVLVWARVERTLVTDPSSIPEEVITHVSRQLSLKLFPLTVAQSPHPRLVKVWSTRSRARTSHPLQLRQVWRATRTMARVLPAQALPAMGCSRRNGWQAPFH